MRKILFSIFTIGVLSILVIGGTMSFFNDTETSVGNTFTAGTIDIAIDDELHWSKNFAWENVEPGNDFTISYNITNAGINPLKLWQITKCLVTGENEIIEPEQAWYDDNNGGSPKNDIDSAIVYQLLVDGNIAVSEKAGITMDKIKDNYVGLVKLDQPFEAGNGDGILQPGESILVEQKYFMKEDTENWAQSDVMTFVIEIEARQVDAPEPLQQMTFMENKLTSGDWSVINDDRMGILKYDYMAPTFNYDFFGVGLEAEKEYCLIYAKDPWGAAKPSIDSGMSDINGKINLAGAKNLGNLPFADDENYPDGAKIWLLPCSDYTGSVGWPPHADWIFDNWPGLINYQAGERPNEELNCEYADEQTDEESDSEQMTAYFDTLGSDIEKQYGYNYDYTEAAADKVYLSYATPMASQFSGTMHATGLKPFATYQIKFYGTPTCLDVNGDDTLNNYIGSIGRWWDNDSGANATDAQKSASPGHCYTGYLVLDYLTADVNGDISASDIAVVSNTSYHVLFCGGGVCNNNSNNFVTYGQSDLNYPEVQFCQASGVNGQPEPDRGGCGGLALSSGTYDLKMSLTEECFHELTDGTQNWAQVLTGDISFMIQ